MTLQQGQTPQTPRPAPHPVIVEGEERRQQSAMRHSLYTAANTAHIEYAYRLWLHQFQQLDTPENFHHFVEAVVADPNNRHYVQSLRELPIEQVLAAMGLSAWPPPGQQSIRPTMPPPRFTPPVAQAATQAITLEPAEVKPLRKAKVVRSEAVKFEMGDFFDTVAGQWVMLVLFTILTFVDWITNVWMLTGEQQIGAALSEATIWHWMLGLLLVWTELYFAMAKSLLRRAAQVQGLMRWMLLGLLVVAAAAVVYDLLATFIPPFNLLAADGEPFAVLGGVILGALLAVITTVGSSKVVEQAIICFQLRKQRTPAQ